MEGLNEKKNCGEMSTNNCIRLFTQAKYTIFFKNIYPKR